MAKLFSRNSTERWPQIQLRICNLLRSQSQLPLDLQAGAKLSESIVPCDLCCNLCCEDKQWSTWGLSKTFLGHPAIPEMTTGWISKNYQLSISIFFPTSNLGYHVILIHFGCHMGEGGVDRSMLQRLHANHEPRQWSRGGLAVGISALGAQVVHGGSQMLLQMLLID